MSRLVARILLAILLLPIAATVAVVTFRELDERSHWPTERSLLAAVAAAGVCVGAYWLLLWRSAVRWTAARGVRTLLATAFVAVGGVSVAFVVAQLGFDGWEAHLVTAAVSTLMICGWLAATVLLWRETPTERAARVAASGGVACPTCGYNLTGLSEARCPECGSRFTSDELLAGQPGRGSELQ